MKSELKANKRLFLREYSLEYEATFEITPKRACLLADTCLRKLLPKEVFRGEPFRDLKGRDAQVLLLDGFPTTSLPHGQELAFLSGELYESEEDLKNPREKRPSFEVSITSPFDEFIGNHHISHRATMTKSELFPEFLPVRLTGFCAPLKINSMRFALETFESKVSFASIGYSPVVTQRLLLDLIGDTLKVLITAEDYRKTKSLPFEETGELGLVSQAIQKISGNDLLSDFLNKVQEHC